MKVKNRKHPAYPRVLDQFWGGLFSGGFPVSSIFVRDGERL